MKTLLRQTDRQIDRQTDRQIDRLTIEQKVDDGNQNNAELECNTHNCAKFAIQS